MIEEPDEGPLVLPPSVPEHLREAFWAQKRAVLQALQDPPNIEGVDVGGRGKALAQLSELLAGSAVRDEGNSCLILGPKGSGKTRVIEEALRELKPRPIIVRLSGHAQINDRLAMKEIARQVSSQLGTSWGQEEDEEMINVETNDFAALPPPAHLPALISSLPSLPRPTIIVMDAFDLFTGHARQALLYCLLDTVQSIRVGEGHKGLAVIGVTSRLDTLTLLEKRVKSRFSHRTIRVGTPATLEEFTGLAKACLTVPPPATSKEWNKIWLASVQRFFESKSVVDWFAETFSIVRSVPLLRNALMSKVVMLKPEAPWLSDDLPRPESNFPQLRNLSYPTAVLLIAAAHRLTSGQAIFTFAALESDFKEYVRIVQSAPVQLAGGSVGMAFENLVEAQIFESTTAASSNFDKRYNKYRCAIEREEIRLAIDRTGQTNLKKWFSRSL
ncbi:hypothetical protein SISNIDRAFT_472560 [Sistotremastrum niveocremeum HHB9708]|uniref:Origin recognition complex subunit 4 n=1 Tax=Sistotremastrum niveocremeum HHB9708 TaxID=1314777 RepID=A0A164Z5R4_9AGAM|nr:hypothetical protein SISNIDRAFT_472560 [Sistotremastrum niveocremeum HHB9708]